MNQQSIAQMWETYKTLNPDTPKVYDAWPFGNTNEMADKLAALVLAGKKTATSSNYQLYEVKGESLPHVGLHNIILNGAGKAVAIVVTTSIEIIPFNEVTEEHAYLEGEGDLSLAYWKEVHEEFFSAEFSEIGEVFEENMLVVCETFKVVYPK